MSFQRKYRGEASKRQEKAGVPFKLESALLGTYLVLISRKSDTLIYTLFYT